MEYDRSDQVRRIVEEHSVTTIEEVADIMLMDEEQIEAHVQVLEERGHISETDGELKVA
jgi:predicted ArsR family transcriptional regulator